MSLFHMFMTFMMFMTFSPKRGIQVFDHQQGYAPVSILFSKN
jgi:hypothetical protein